MPDHRRSLRARYPPTYHPTLDQTFVKCTTEEIINTPTTRSCSSASIILMSPASIGCKLQQLACASGNKRTKIEALSAYVWKIMVTAIDGKHQKCKMGWLVDGQSSVHGDQNLMPNNIRNMFSVGVAEATITEQKQRSLY